MKAFRRSINVAVIAKNSPIAGFVAAQSRCAAIASRGKSEKCRPLLRRRVNISHGPHRAAGMFATSTRKSCKLAVIVDNPGQCLKFGANKASARHSPARADARLSSRWKRAREGFPNGVRGASLSRCRIYSGPQALWRSARASLRRARALPERRRYGDASATAADQPKSGK